MYTNELASWTSDEVDCSLTHAARLIYSISYVASCIKKSTYSKQKLALHVGKYEQSIFI